VVGVEGIENESRYEKMHQFAAENGFLWVWIHSISILLLLVGDGHIENVRQKQRRVHPLVIVRKEVGRGAEHIIIQIIGVSDRAHNANLAEMRQIGVDARAIFDDGITIENALSVEDDGARAPVPCKWRMRF